MTCSTSYRVVTASGIYETYMYIVLYCIVLYTSSSGSLLLCKRSYQINSYGKIQQDTSVYENLLFHIYMKLNMFRATHRPSSRG
jgi:hypothetical protein